MKEIEFRVIFNRKNKLNSKGQGLVQIEAYQSGLRRYFNTGVKVSPQEWKPKPKRDIWVSDNHQNLLIVNVKTALRKYRDTFVAVHGRMSLRDFDNYLEPAKEGFRVIQTDFLGFYELELKKELNGREGVRITHSTWQQLKSNLTCLKECFPEGLTFDELNYAAIDRYNQFLMCRKGRDGQGMKLNSIHKRHRHTIKFVRLAIKKNYLSPDKDPYLSFKKKTEEVKKEWLTANEWKRMEELSFGEDERPLELARDMFLFSTYTGLRYSDVHNLTAQDFIQTEKGLLLTFKSKKTTKSLFNLPLHLLWNGKPEQIAKKYINNGFKRLFHGMYNTSANKLIKQVAKLAKIEKYITFHDSRDTFGTHAVRKLPITAVQNLLQHGDIRTTKGYLHLDDDERDDLLEKTNWN